MLDGVNEGETFCGGGVKEGAAVEVEVEELEDDELTLELEL